MKKKNKKNHIRKRFSTLLLCILAILLCAAPRGWAVDLYDGEEHDVREDIIGCLVIGNGTTVNLYASVEKYVTLGPHSVLNIYSGGSVEQSVYVGPDSVLNIYSGSVGSFISLNEYADVTVYGTDFGGEGDFSVPGQVSYSGGILTGIYGNGDSIELWFLSDISIKLKAPDSMVVPMVVAIDIKPGGNPNRINLKSKGVVPVAVLTTDDFDAGTIEPDTVTFAGAAPVRWKLEDVDDDGDVDMLFHFRTHDLKLDESITKAAEAAESTETTLRLTGNRTDGEVIQGTDEVRIVVPGKK